MRIIPVDFGEKDRAVPNSRPIGRFCSALSGRSSTMSESYKRLFGKKFGCECDTYSDEGEKTRMSAQRIGDGFGPQHEGCNAVRLGESFVSQLGPGYRRLKKASRDLEERPALSGQGRGGGFLGYSVAASSGVFSVFTGYFLPAFDLYIRLINRIRAKLGKKAIKPATESWWGVMHCLWHCVITQKMNIGASGLVSIIWEAFELLLGVPWREAVADIFVYDRVGDVCGANTKTIAGCVACCAWAAVALF